MMGVQHPLRYERDLRGWSQARVAMAIGTTAVSVSQWERGILLPSPFFRERLCTLFEKDAAALGLLPGREHELPRDTGEVCAIEPLQPGDHSTLTEPLASARLYDPALPLYPTSRSAAFVGRETLQTQLKARIMQRGTLLVLSGLPGVGKTTLAIELAHDAEVQAHFRDGILWAGLGPQPDIVQALSHWGDVLGIASGEHNQFSSNKEWASAIRAAIARRRMLLIIDDVWHCEDALALLVGGPGCAYLLTTRSAAQAAALSSGGVIAVPELYEEDGLHLLTRLAPAIASQPRETLLSLVRAVGGLPLALTLVGEHLRQQTYSGHPRRIRTALKQVQQAEYRLRLALPHSPLEHPPSLELSTPLSLQAAIAVSDQRLAPSARMALRALAVFPAKPNSFSEEAALAVAQVSGEVLDQLSDAGLLESPHVGRYSLHQTIVDYVHLHRQDNREAQARLVQYMVSYVQAHEHDYELLEQESSNILAGLEAALQMQWWSELLPGVLAMASFLQAREFSELTEQQLQHALQVAQELEEAADGCSALPPGRSCQTVRSL